jgi:hypothetical protein
MRSTVRSAFQRLSGAVLVAVIAMCIGSAGAAADRQPSIEGVWAFNGGQVVVAPNAAGGLVGTVTAPTTFVACTHPVGQAIWTDLQQLPDGSYSGMHQWYRGSDSSCHPSQLGPTAFRVITRSDGSRFLRVCFNTPGSGAPAIAPDGTSSGVNYGCTNSALVAAVPDTAPAFGTSIILPSAGPKHVCLSRRHFVIHVREPRHDPFVMMRIYLGHKLLKVFRHGDEITALIDLRGLPKGTYTVRIRARTAAGFVIKGKRTYHTCVPKRA